MIYCVCRGNTRGRGLCYSRAVTSTTCWFCSTPHTQHKATALQSLVCWWSGCSIANGIWESRDSNAIAGPFVVHWMCFYGSWSIFLSTVEAWMFLIHRWWAHLLAMIFIFPSFMLSQWTLLLLGSQGTSPLRPSSTPPMV